MMRRKRKIIRLMAIGIAMLVITAIVIIARPGWHLLRTALNDPGALPDLPAGHFDDVSRMNLTPIHDVIEVDEDQQKAEAQLAALLEKARNENLRVSIAGARHTMGGHTMYPDGIVIDMRTFSRFKLDETKNVLWTQAGAHWSEIIPYLDQHGRSIAIMQSNNSFTVGGSISANCHGWPPNHPPIASTVRSFRLMLADGSIVSCSRAANAELFSLALGGYGLFGIILDVELDVVSNERCTIDRYVVASAEIPELFEREVLEREALMSYGRLRITEERFLEDAVLNVVRRDVEHVNDIPELTEPTLTALKRSVFRGSAESDYGKALRWNAELALSDQLSQQAVSRNQLMNDPVDWYLNRSQETTDILHEYFVPPAQFESFIATMREIIPKYEGNLLNVTIRHVAEDKDTFLRYADQEMFALVLFFCQQRTAEADAQMQAMTQELIDAVLAHGGRYYLPYRLHATVEQFNEAYPNGQQFFELKRTYDPQELFQNKFYVKYGRGSDGGTGVPPVKTMR